MLSNKMMWGGNVGGGATGVGIDPAQLQADCSLSNDNRTVTKDSGTALGYSVALIPEGIKYGSGGIDQEFYYEVTYDVVMDSPFNNRMGNVAAGSVLNLLPGQSGLNSFGLAPPTSYQQNGSTNSLSPILDVFVGGETIGIGVNPKQRFFRLYDKTGTFSAQYALFAPANNLFYQPVIGVRETGDVCTIRLSENDLVHGLPAGAVVYPGAE